MRPSVRIHSLELVCYIVMKLSMNVYIRMCTIQQCPLSIKKRHLFRPDPYLKIGLLDLNETWHECVYQYGNDANQIPFKSTRAVLSYGPLFIKNRHFFPSRSLS